MSSPGPNDCHSAIWRCLANDNTTNYVSKADKADRELYGPQHSDPDIISLRAVDGIVISGRPPGCTQLVTSLDSDTIITWLQEGAQASSSIYEPRIRLLMADQVAQHDGLRPSVSLAETHIAKTMLAQYLHIPTAATERLGYEVAHALTYPATPNALLPMACHSLNGGAYSAAWCHDRNTGTTTAFVVFRSGGSPSARQRISSLLEALSSFSNLPSIIPYILMDVTARYVLQNVRYNERDSSLDHRHLLSGLVQIRPFEMFGIATTRFQGISGTLKHTESVLKMSRQQHTKKLHRPGHTTDEEWAHMQTSHQSLQQLIRFRQQELESLIFHAKHIRDNALALQSTVMGLMSFNQQQTSQEIAEATHKDSKTMKEIAAATRKDSTSMKILAFITVLFLPSMSASAVMAIPSMFDFSDGSAQLVSPRFWIFFAIAVPLTLATMVFTWWWLRWESQGRQWAVWLGWTKIGRSGDCDGDEKSMV